MTNPTPIVLIRGGGDLASGVAYRLHRVGVKVVITELPQPLAVRRLVSFGEAVYSGVVTIEEITARRVHSLDEALAALARAEIPVLVDPDLNSLRAAHFDVVALVDARLTKRPTENGEHTLPFLIGLGPGFQPGHNCHAAIETNRGHQMGRVLWQGATQVDTGIPEAVGERGAERVLRAPVGGILRTHARIGDHLHYAQIVASITRPDSPIEASRVIVTAPFDGILRGLLHDGLPVRSGDKIGDLDPRNDARLALQISDKALAVGGGVLEVLFSRPEIRARLWT